MLLRTQETSYQGDPALLRAQETFERARRCSLSIRDERPWALQQALEEHRGTDQVCRRMVAKEPPRSTSAPSPLHQWRGAGLECVSAQPSLRVSSLGSVPMLWYPVRWYPVQFTRSHPLGADWTYTWTGWRPA